MEALFSQWVFALSLVLVVLGLGLLLAAYYMGRQARRALGLMDELLSLASRHEDGPLRFVPTSLHLLRRAGLAFARVELRWFGQQAAFGEGQRMKIAESACEVRVLGSGEIEAQVLLCPKGGLRGEQQVLYTMMVRLWMRLLSSQINGRLAQLHLSEQQLRRYELFYKHDLKNLAQFMGLLSVQLRQCARPEQAMALVERLQKLLPALERRAGRILDHLDRHGHEGWSAVDSVDLSELVQAVAHELELPVTIEGRARVALVEGPMVQGLQNVLENFRHHLGLHAVSVRIHQTDDAVEMTLTSPRMTGGLDDQTRVRMFEPFWTTSESGMGLGLYIARQSVQQACGGTLDAAVLDEKTGQWGFVIRCPRPGGAVSDQSEDSAPPSPDSPVRPPE